MPVDIAARQRIEDIWRQINGHPKSVSLAGSNKEWEFFETLLKTRYDDIPVYKMPPEDETWSGLFVAVDESPHKEK